MLELDGLLAPISTDNPAGEDLSFSLEFDQIQEFRRADDPSLDQGEWQTDIKSADWPKALLACGELLRHRSKDLRLAGWFAEASAQTRGFAGLAEGYRLIAGLCRDYWHSVHPIAVDADQEDRIGNLSWLLSSSLRWLRMLPIVAAPQGRYTLADFESSLAPGLDADRPDTERLEAARRDTSPEFYRETLAAAADCAAALTELQSAVDARLGLAGPSFTPVRDQLEQLQHTLRRFAGLAAPRLEAEVVPSVQARLTEREGAQQAQDLPAGLELAAPASRQQALQQLRQVAAFFRRTEPHSPVAYLAEKAARWGELPLHAWLRRVIRDESVLQQMEELLDLEPPAAAP